MFPSIKSLLVLLLFFFLYTTLQSCFSFSASTSTLHGWNVQSWRRKKAERGLGRTLRGGGNPASSQSIHYPLGWSFACRSSGSLDISFSSWAWVQLAFLGQGKGDSGEAETGFGKPQLRSCLRWKRRDEGAISLHPAEARKLPRADPRLGKSGCSWVNVYPNWCCKVNTWKADQQRCRGQRVLEPGEPV